MPVTDHPQKDFVRQIFGGSLPSDEPEEKTKQRPVPARSPRATAVISSWSVLLFTVLIQANRAYRKRLQ